MLLVASMMLQSLASHEGYVLKKEIAAYLKLGVRVAVNTDQNVAGVLSSGI
jgi:hypothetical protein